jgi:hypothetical protein
MVVVYLVALLVLVAALIAGLWWHRRGRSTR